MEIISNQTLRALLTKWPYYHEEILDDQEIGRKIVLEDLLPYFASQGISLRSPMNGWADWPTDQDPIATNPELIDRLLSDPKFKTLVQYRYGFWAHAGGEYDNAIEAAQKILGLIDAELAGRGVDTD